ncbi:MAG: efflux transporter outer membrane subunit [Magnetococcales bacterium]|nr:efflux transporter outer membrane subunit [Magnetococcales bacterium]
MGLSARHDSVCPLLRLVLALLLLGGCTLIDPMLHPEPAAPATNTWQARLPHDGSPLALTDWWGQFHDPTLLQLLEISAASHPTLHRALAAIQEARATLVVRQAEDQPKADGALSLQRSGNHSTPPPGPMGVMVLPESTTQAVALDAQWELDLFGRVRAATTAATARLEERLDNWHEARVTLAAEVASQYVHYRACHQLQNKDERLVASWQETVRMTEKAEQAGLTASLDLHLAQARGVDAQAARTAQQAACERIVKALVSLTGLAEPALREMLQTPSGTIPQPTAFVVESLPADLLAQRPDLAALERDLAAAGADVGVAEANRYPRLTILGNGSLSTLHMTHTAVTTQPWSLGPTLSLPLLDGGARNGQVAEARARYEQAHARYLGAIRTAVEEVETALVNLDSVRQRTANAQETAAHYAAMYQSTQAFWRAGGVSQLALEEGQRTLLMAERAAMTLQGEAVQAWITLYKALGGGWQTGGRG